MAVLEDQSAVDDRAGLQIASRLRGIAGSFSPDYVMMVDGGRTEQLGVMSCLSNVDDVTDSAGRTESYDILKRC